MNNTAKTVTRLVNKQLPFRFKEGQVFIVKVANTVIGSISVVKVADRLVVKVYTTTTGSRSFTDYPYLLNDEILKGYAIYELVPETVEGVVKTEQDKERYIVWCPASTSPCQQIFTSARQARYVAYRMSEEHKGKVFHWAKLEGSAQWGELPNEL